MLRNSRPTRFITDDNAYNDRCIRRSNEYSTSLYCYRIQIFKKGIINSTSLNYGDRDRGIIYINLCTVDFSRVPRIFRHNNLLTASEVHDCPPGTIKETFKRRTPVYPVHRNADVRMLAVIEHTYSAREWVTIQSVSLPATKNVFLIGN